MADSDDFSAQPPRDASVLEVVEERIHIDKHWRDAGGVRLQTVTEVAQEVHQVPLRSEQIEVRRVPVDRVVETAPPIREEGDITIIPVLEERAVMRTELVLVEEVHLIRKQVVETLDVPINLRKQRVVETRLDAAGQPITQSQENQE